MEPAFSDPPILDRVPADGGIDLRQALVRLGDDRELLRELARIYIEDAPGLLATAAMCINAADIAEAARSAHSLKGLAANFSAPAADAAHALETAIRSGDRSRIDSTLATLRLFNDRLIDELNRSVLDESRSET